MDFDLKLDNFFTHFMIITANLNIYSFTYLFLNLRFDYYKLFYSPFYNNFINF